MASRGFPRAPSSSPTRSRVEATAPPPSPSSLASASVPMGSSSPSPSPPPPPPPMIGRAGNLTVFITPPSPASTPRSSRPSESPRSDLSTPASRTAPAPPVSPSPQKRASPPPSPVKFSPPALPVKVFPSPVQVPPAQYEKASAGDKHDGSAFAFFWDAVARVQEGDAMGNKICSPVFFLLLGISVLLPISWIWGFLFFGIAAAHASLDEYVANWFGLDQSKYQWALNDYYENTGKEVECGKAGKPKELLTTKVQKV
ncbi:hypothetical protein BRADI_1g71450v3 [Brachypodium distachyon]|uniref:Uncharacterized protein n=1 Tax=Brachypodium distachyon TaxID=15368 RepID=A0A0Q3HJU5_BRADI|nr:hypothetical protein BRADI_1g71450v3 [Brachypodium distachyon]